MQPDSQTQERLNRVEREMSEQGILLGRIEERVKAGIDANKERVRTTDEKFGVLMAAVSRVDGKLDQMRNGARHNQLATNSAWSAGGAGAIGMVFVLGKLLGWW